MDALTPIRLVRHGCVELAHEGVVIAVDPYLIRHAQHDADLVIITHGHADHYSPADLALVRKADTCYAAPQEVAQKLEQALGVDRAYLTRMTAYSPETVFECGAVVRPVPAVNHNHPVGTGFGVQLDFAGYRYYLSGDTDVLASDIDCDVLFVCCDGVYNMPQFEKTIPAAVLAMDQMPKLVVPYHYGEPGMEENGAKLCAALQAAGIPCTVWHE